MTEKSNIQEPNLDALGQILERLGADRTRWPAPVRRDFAGLIARDPEAKARLREAEALDRLLDLAPQPEIDTRALASRIVAAARAEAQAVPQPRARVAWAKLDRRAAEAQWPAAALLAASLVIGAFVGLNGALDAAVSPLVAGVSSETDIDSGRIAFDSGATDMFEEDLL